MTTIPTGKATPMTTTSPPPLPLRTAAQVADALALYEQGTLSWDDTRRLFQHLIDTGLVWQLQGHYGRVAAALLDDGIVTAEVQP